MFQSLKPVFSFIRSVLSEPDGTGSSTRVITTALVSFTIVVGISFAVLVHLHKMTVAEFNSVLNSSGTFLVTTTTPLYAANKASDWLKSKTQQNGPQQ